MSNYENERFAREAHEREQTRKAVTFWSKIAVGTLVVLIVAVFAFQWGWKAISVWSREQDGRAAIAEARYSKDVQIEEARANLASEKLNAEAEFERAKGAAKAIEAEGGALTPEYITYLWVRNLERGDNQLIYVPTEGGLPILEAGRTPLGEQPEG
jgi:hypothetical protein